MCINHYFIQGEKEKEKTIEDCVVCHDQRKKRDVMIESFPLPLLIVLE